MGARGSTNLYMFMRLSKFIGSEGHEQLAPTFPPGVLRLNDFLQMKDQSWNDVLMGSHETTSKVQKKNSLRSA